MKRRDGLRRAAGASRLLRRSGGDGPSPEDQPLDVVDEVGHPDFHSGARDADRADEEAHPVLLLGEDMFDARANGRFEGVRPTDRVGHGPTLGLLAMDAADEAVLGEERLIGGRAIGRVGPDRRRRVALVVRGSCGQTERPRAPLL